MFLRGNRAGDAPDAATARDLSSYLVRPDPSDPRLTETVRGVDEHGRLTKPACRSSGRSRRPEPSGNRPRWMTIGDRPEDLAVGYLLNQNMLRPMT